MEMVKNILIAVLLIVLGFELGLLFCVWLEERTMHDLDEKTWERIEGWKK